MKNLTNYLISEHNISDDQLSKLQSDINSALQSEGSTLKNGIPCKFGPIVIDDNVAKQWAGYVCEVVVKSLLKDALQSNDSEFGWQIDYSQVPEEKWYDYSIKELNAKVEIKSCLNGKLSNVKLTNAQSSHKNELIFALVNYSVSGGVLKVNNVELINGSDLNSSGKNNDRLRR